MKKLKFVLLALVCLVLVASCTRKGCTDTKALNYDPEATKDDGSCEPFKISFIGNFLLSDTVNSSPTPLPVTISYLPNDSNSYQVNFTSVGLSFFANPLPSGTDLVIPNQTNSGLVYQGTGKLNSNILTLNFTLFTIASNQTNTFNFVGPKTQ